MAGLFSSLLTGLPAAVGSVVEDPLDQLGRLRYGVPTSEKERLARTGELPGAPTYNPTLSDEENMERADRYASGYLFGKARPQVSSFIQPLIDMLKTSDLPAFGGSSPELQSYASEGARRGRFGY